MSKPTPPGGTDVRPQQSIGRTVNDEEKKSQTSSIERIQQFRDHLADYQVWFAQNEISQEVSREKQTKSYHRMAQGFLRVLRPYLTDPSLTPNEQPTAESEHTGNEYWHHINLGEFAIDPPEILQRPSQRATENAVKSHDRGTLARADPRNTAESHHYRVVGLKNFGATDPEWSVSWTMMFGPEISVRDLRMKSTEDTVTIRDRDHRNQPVTITKTVRLPKHIVDNAVTSMENFVRDIGMDIEFNGEDYMADDGPGI